MTANKIDGMAAFIDALWPTVGGRSLRPAERRLIEAMESGKLQILPSPRLPGKRRARMLGAAFRYGNAVVVPLSELDGAALAWAVAIVEGYAPTILPASYGVGPRVVVVERGQSVDREVVFRPHVDWCQAGPLLDRWLQSFGVARNPDKTCRAFSLDPDGQTMRLAGGPTLLVAACRARVRNLFGDQLLIPEVLLWVP